MNSLEEFEPEFLKNSKENPFVVPEGYFDSLPSRVQVFCEKKVAKREPVKWFVTARTQVALAAGFCFLVFLALSGYYFLKPYGNARYFDRVDYMKVVVESGTEFDERQLYDAVFNGSKKDTVKTITNQEVIEYIYNENPDYGTIMDHTKEIKP